MTTSSSTTRRHFMLGAAASGIALGALATVFVLLRAISIPDEFFFAGRGIGLWISLLASVALIGAGLLQASEEL